MSALVYYLIAIFVLSTVLVLCYFFARKSEKILSLFLKIISVIFSIVFVCRYMLGNDAIEFMFRLSNTPIENGFLNFCALILVWFTYAGNILLELYGFFNIRRIDKYIKYISFPLAILNFVFMPFSFLAVIGKNAFSSFSLRGIIFAIEIGIMLGYSLFILINKTDWKNLFSKKFKKSNVQKNEQSNINLQNTEIKQNNIEVVSERKERKFYNKLKIFFQKSWQIVKNCAIIIARFFKKYWYDIFCVLVIFLSVMPSYTLQGIFGKVQQPLKAKSL